MRVPTDNYYGRGDVDAKSRQALRNPAPLPYDTFVFVPKRQRPHESYLKRLGALEGLLGSLQL